MKRNQWWNPRLGLISTSIILITIHFVLLELLSRFDVVSCIFAAGDHLPKWMAASALIFVVIRLAVFLALPAIIAWRITTFFLGRRIGDTTAPSVEKP